jgi:hypothetical protein
MTFCIIPALIDGVGKIYSKKHVNTCALCGCNVSKKYKRACLRLCVSSEPVLIFAYFSILCPDCDPIRKGDVFVANMIQKSFKFCSGFIEAVEAYNMSTNPKKSLLRFFDRVESVLLINSCFYCVSEIKDPKAAVHCAGGIHVFCNEKCFKADYKHTSYCSTVPAYFLEYNYKIVLRKRFPTSNAGGL